MAKGGGSTTQTTKVELPKWVDQAAQYNYNLAQEIANKPYTPGIAPTSELTELGYDYFRNDPRAGGLLSMDRAAYTNPFTSEVVDAALGDLEQSRIKSLMSNSDAAIKARAFGGSRHGVVDAVTNSETARAAGTLSANLRSAAFDKASELMQQDINNGRANTAGLLAAGAQQQGQAQAELDDVNNYDINRLNILLSALGMSPYGKSETAKSTSSGSGVDWASTGLGILGLVGNLFNFSDKEAKTDIEKLGKDPDTGLDMYAYRYKNDPKTYPKVVGPMAQDIEKKYPGAVKKIGGKRVVKVG